MMLLYWLFRIPCIAQGHERDCQAAAPSLGCSCNVRKLRVPTLREAAWGHP